MTHKGKGLSTYSKKKQGHTQVAYRTEQMLEALTQSQTCGHRTTDKRRYRLRSAHT